MKHLVGAALALLAGGAHAEEVASTVHGGIGAAWREPAVDAVDYDTGTLLHLTLASRYEYGLLLRVDYAYTLYDALTANGLPVAKDIEQHDARGGAYYAPWTRSPVAWRIGGGYAWAREDEDEPARELTQDGGFVEAGIAVKLGDRVVVDVAGAGLKLEGDGDYDAEGSEARLGLTIDAGPLDVTVGARYIAWQRENTFDEDVFELRVGLGGNWGYPENRW
jgi:hypothetical protein